jgi:4-amino-4-deoxy-L-arabinose transferase-like glycosyltransferase
MIETAPEPVPKTSPLNATAKSARALGLHPYLAVTILLTYCGLLFFYGLGNGELYRTESLRAILAAEFLRSGNWVVPTLYGEPIFTKPPGMYAAIALLSLPGGHVTEWTARAPSAIAATITVLVFFAVFWKRLGIWQGLVAGLILPASFMWLDKASAAEIDMMQVAWIAGAILSFLKALEIHEASGVQSASRIEILRVSPSGQVQEQAAPQRDPSGLLWFWWTSALLCVAGGVLTKWTAPAFFYATVIAMLARRGRLGLLFSRYHLVAAAVGASLCFAWMAAAIYLAGWPALYETVSREALMRLSPHHHPGPYPWQAALLHPLKILAANLPWTIPALLTLRPGFGQLWNQPERRLLQLMHCWFWPSLLFWTLIPEHAMRHSFPMYPAVSGLAAFVVCAWLSGRIAWRSPAFCRPALLLTVLLVVWIGVKLVHVHAIVPARSEHRAAHAKGTLLASLVPPGVTLNLFRLKDEGILFYYGRPALRWSDPTALASFAEPAYCILDGEEWQRWQDDRRVELLRGFSDEQGDPIYLICWRFE